MLQQPALNATAAVTRALTNRGARLVTDSASVLHKAKIPSALLVKAPGLEVHRGFVLEYEPRNADWRRRPSADDAKEVVKAIFRSLCLGEMNHTLITDAGIETLRAALTLRGHLENALSRRY